MGWIIAPGVEANILAECNIFINVSTALAAGWYNTSADATLAEVGNAFLGSAVGKYGDPVFDPPYSYTSETVDAALEADVRANTGVTLDVSM